MTTVASLPEHGGVWWWPKHPNELLQQLGDAGDGWLRQACVVPAGAPLLERLTPIANCRAYCRLFNQDPTPFEVLKSLRILEIADSDLSRHSRHQDLFHRTLVWLAMARLTQSQIVVLIDPLPGSSPRDRESLGRLLCEALDHHTHIFVVANNPEVAVDLGARRMALVAGGAP